MGAKPDMGAGSDILHYGAVLDGYSVAGEALSLNISASMVLSDGVLRLTFELTGAIGGIDLPGARPVRRADELWKGTCFELFLAKCHEPGYLELNVSPDLRWNIYLFDEYRKGMKEARLPETPRIVSNVSNGKFHLDFTARLPALPKSEAAHPGEPAGTGQSACHALNLCAILKDQGGRLHYYCLDTSPKPPDFHNRASFISVPLNGQGNKS